MSNVGTLTTIGTREAGRGPGSLGVSSGGLQVGVVGREAGQPGPGRQSSAPHQLLAHPVSRGTVGVRFGAGNVNM